MSKDTQSKAPKVDFNELVDHFTRDICDGVITGGFGTVRAKVISALATARHHESEKNFK